jgi:spore maturation protein SpmB
MLNLSVFKPISLTGAVAFFTALTKAQTTASIDLQIAELDN